MPMTEDQETRRGVFITFEGGEGVGKSTQIRHLAARLQRVGISRLTTTREPGGSQFAEFARTLLLNPELAPTGALAQALLLSAARSDHLEATIRPMIRRGGWVVCDRFSDSTLAYQGAAGGVPIASLKFLETMVVGGDTPDLTILLDLDPQLGLARAHQRREATTDATAPIDTFESQRLDFHQRLREGFLAIARAAPERVLVIDAALDEVAIADLVWARVSAKFADQLAPFDVGH